MTADAAACGLCEIGIDAGGEGAGLGTVKVGVLEDADGDLEVEEEVRRR